LIEWVAIAAGRQLVETQHQVAQVASRKKITFQRFCTQGLASRFQVCIVELLFKNVREAPRFMGLDSVPFPLKRGGGSLAGQKQSSGLNVQERPAGGFLKRGRQRDLFGVERYPLGRDFSRSSQGFFKCFEDQAQAWGEYFGLHSGSSLLMQFLNCPESGIHGDEHWFPVAIEVGIKGDHGTLCGIGFEVKRAVAGTRGLGG
jgi:hypothetical protein